MILNLKLVVVSEEASRFSEFLTAAIVVSKFESNLSVDHRVSSLLNNKQHK
jgi:hypothetical protein